MGLVASLFSALKAEVEWLITSLAVASGSETAVSADTRQADSASTFQHDSVPSLDTQVAIPTLADQQSDNGTGDHAGTQHATSDDAVSPSSNVEVTDVATGHPANLLMTTEFTIDTTDKSGPPPSPGLTPISTEPNASDLSSISASPDASTTHDQDHVVPLENDSHVAIAQPHSAAGEFALASLAPQLRGDLAHGSSSAGGASHGGKGLTYDTSLNGNIHNGLDVVVKFDSSVANAPGGLGGTGLGTFVGDVEAVANFFASNFTTVDGTTQSPTMITIDVGYGEVAGSHIGSGVLGESETSYQSVPGGYSALQGSVNTHTGFSEAAAIEGSTGSQMVNIPASNPLGSASQQWWVTTAEAKALGLSPTNSSIDGSIGLASGSGTFFYGSAPSGTENDFIGTVAHEISEVMGRSTLNAGKYFGGHSPEYMPLDLFHFSGDSARIYSGTTPGYFSIDSGHTDLENFNTRSSGDLSDWATGSSSTLPVHSFTEDSFDWDGNGGLAPVSYADYLAMEAVGWTGITSASEWQTFG